MTNNGPDSSPLGVPGGGSAEAPPFSGSSPDATTIDQGGPTLDLKPIEVAVGRGSIPERLTELQDNVAGEDFLFHLYRGSEFLQDNRVIEAKLELEQALSLQPRDSKGQDLLAIVYFRLGLYPRAIAIYESLIAMYPQSATPRVNLALCYLKTGQAAGARAELERVLELNPRHNRAWGYLGLAFQRLGDYERACHAFITGGHDVMARRLMELIGPSSNRPGRGNDTPPSGVPLRRGSATERAPASQATPSDESEGDAQSSDENGSSSTAETSGTWSAMDPPRDAMARPSTRPMSPSVLPSLAPTDSLLPPVSPTALGLASVPASFRPKHLDTLDFPLPPPPEPARFDPELTRARATEPPISKSPSIVPHLDPPEQPEVFARRMLLVFPRLHQAALHPSGLVVLKVTESATVRFDLVRSLSFPSGQTTRALSRRARGREIDEPLGGAASPLFELIGSGEIVLGPTVGARLAVLTATLEPLFVRENALTAFEGPVLYESGRLAGSDGDVVPMVQLRAAPNEEGDASHAIVVLSLPTQVAAIEVIAGRPVLVRTHSVIGWTGRVTPRNLPPSEAPAKARGFVSLSGEGMVIVDGR